MKWYLYDWCGFNIWLFHLINNIHNSVIDRIMLAATAAASHEHFTLYLAVLALMGTAVVARTSAADRQKKALLWISTIALFSVAYLLDGWFLGAVKPFLDFPRPPLALPIETIHIIGQAEYHHSLPSGHSSFAMLVAASIWPLLVSSWQRYTAVFFVLLAGLSRISLGAHFPSDVVAGWISSLLIVLLVRFAIRKLVISTTFEGIK